MPVVVFESGGRAIAIAAPGGAQIVDLCDEHGARVAFSCRSASCGMCRVHVLEGGALLEPAADSELDLLARMGDDPAHTRLACQARLRAGEPDEGEIRLRARAGGECGESGERGESAERAPAGRTSEGA